MKPRKEQSIAKKFQPLPKDFCDLAIETFKDAFKDKMQGYGLEINGRLYPEEIIVRLSLAKKSELKQHNFSVSVDHTQDMSNALDQMHLGIDILASFLEDYLEATAAGEDLDVPLDWHGYEVEGQQIYLVYDSDNDDLEKKANELLGITEDVELVDEDELGQDFFGEKPDPEDMH
ncbi:MAG: hypothetical protein KDD37_01335 [Bdellovibrionales bacterium]|nr:hypothetical protein [Bdellovibrionales bacterium]